MDRRGFLANLIGGIAAGAAVRTFPFRVFSFPSEIILAPTQELGHFVGQSVVIDGRKGGLIGPLAYAERFYPWSEITR